MDAYIGESSPGKAGEVRVRAAHAVIIYGKSYEQTQYASVHEITEAKGKLRLGAGAPLTDAFAVSFLRSIGEDLKVEFLPGRVLYRTHDRTVWWSPPRRESMRFRTGSELEPVSGKPVALPGLVWRLSSQHLSVRAVAGADRPTPTTPLCVAPLWNTAPADGVVCEGSMPRPRGRGPGAIEDWEDAFFGSEFTHQAGAGSLCSGGAYPALVKRLAADQCDFPGDALVGAGITLGAFASEGAR